MRQGRLLRDSRRVARRRRYRNQEGVPPRSHPDVSKAPDARERFMEIQNAYSVLSDPAKRRAYDRSSSSAASTSFGGFEDFAVRATAGASGFSSGAADFARKWKEKNPMPEDLNDNLGSIFSDLFSDVSGAVGDTAGAAPGIVEDFVEFLETQVSGVPRGSASGYDSDGSSDDGLDDVLAKGSAVVLEAELEDTSFLLTQLRAREAQLRTESEKVVGQAREWSARAARYEEELDVCARDEARERETELNEEAARLRKRRKKVQRHIAAQEERLARITEALSNRQTRTAAKKQSAAGGFGVVAAMPSTKEQRRREVDEELERLKKEMGL
jgi:curved DNA-binding protein CbpA